LINNNPDNPPISNSHILPIHPYFKYPIILVIMKLKNNGLIVIVLSLIWIFIQCIFPDLVPDFINKAITDNALHPQIGVDSILKVISYVYVFSGLFAFIAGIITWGFLAFHHD